MSQARHLNTQSHTLLGVSSQNLKTLLPWVGFGLSSKPTPLLLLGTFVIFWVLFWKGLRSTALDNDHLKMPSLLVGNRVPSPNPLSPFSLIWMLDVRLMNFSPSTSQFSLSSSSLSKLLRPGGLRFHDSACRWGVSHSLGFPQMVSSNTWVLQFQHELFYYFLSSFCFLYSLSRTVVYLILNFRDWSHAPENSLILCEKWPYITLLN